MRQFGGGQFSFVWFGAFMVSALSTNWWLGCRACQYVIKSLKIQDSGCKVNSCSHACR